LSYRAQMGGKYEVGFENVNWIHLRSSGGHLANIVTDFVIL